MTTAAKARDYEAIAQDRWDMLTLGIDQSDATRTNSALMTDLQNILREFMAGIIHGIDGRPTPRSMVGGEIVGNPAWESEYNLVCQAEEACLEVIERQALALAANVERLRDEREAARVA